MSDSDIAFLDANFGGVDHGRVALYGRSKVAAQLVMDRSALAHVIGRLDSVIANCEDLRDGKQLGSSDSSFLRHHCGGIDLDPVGLGEHVKGARKKLQSVYEKLQAILGRVDPAAAAKRPPSASRVDSAVTASEAASIPLPDASDDSF